MSCNASSGSILYFASTECARCRRTRVSIFVVLRPSARARCGSHVRRHERPVRPAEPKPAASDGRAACTEARRPPHHPAAAGEPSCYCGWKLRMELFAFLFQRILAKNLYKDAASPKNWIQRGLLSRQSQKNSTVKNAFKPQKCFAFKCLLSLSFPIPKKCFAFNPKKMLSNAFNPKKCFQSQQMLSIQKKSPKIFRDFLHLKAFCWD